MKATIGEYHEYFSWTWPPELAANLSVYVARKTDHKLRTSPWWPSKVTAPVRHLESLADIIGQIREKAGEQSAGQMPDRTRETA